MDKIGRYKITEDIEYWKMSLNNKILEYQPTRGGTDIKLEEEQVQEVINSVSFEPKKSFLIDFSNINKIAIDSKTSQSLLALKNAVLYFNDLVYSNFTDKVNKLMIKEKIRCSKDQKGVIIYHSDGNEDLNNYICKNINEELDFIKRVHAYIYASFFIEEIEKHGHKYDMNNLKYLESSNAYVNCYINVKSMFSKPNYMYLMVNDLIETIKTNFDNIEKVCLLGVSNNGIILSHLLAYELGLEAKSINHLGPKYCLASDKEVMQEFRNRKFILISDVICLGGEYRLAKGILGILDAKLLGAVSVVKIRDVYRNDKEELKYKWNRRADKIYAIIDNICEFEVGGKKIDYKVFVDKGE